MSPDTSPPTEQRLRLRVDDPRAETVTAVVHRPATAAGRPVLLTHGAGGDLDGAGLTALAAGLAAAGHVTVRANLPYREAGSGGPPRADRAVPGFVSLAAAAQAEIAAGAWVVGGKSYGGRVASLAVAEGLDAAGLVFYGYPLHAPGKPDQPRVEHWPRIDVACLFLQGTRDPFCDLTELVAHLPTLAGTPTLHVVDGGDHSLKVTGRAAPDGVARSETRSLTDLADIVADWLAAHS